MPPQSSVVKLERSTTFGRSGLTTRVRSESPLLEVVTVVSHAVLIFWNVVACPPRASERVQGWSAGGDKFRGVV